MPPIQSNEFYWVNSLIKAVYLFCGPGGIRTLVRTNALNMYYMFSYVSLESLKFGLRRLEFQISESQLL